MNRSKNSGSSHADRIHALQGARACQHGERAAPAQPAEDQGQVCRQAARIADRAGRLRSHARGRTRDSPARARRPRRVAGDLRTQRNGARRDGALGRDARRDQRACARHRAPARCAKDDQVEVDGERGVRARPGDRSRRAYGRRDRPRRVHPADQRLRAAVASHRSGAAQEQRRSCRPVRQGPRHSAQDRDRRAVSGGEGRAAPALSDRRHGHLRRQFLRR